MNTDDLAFELTKAERRVLEIQTKLHRWAAGDSSRRFDDLFNLVADPAFLLVAWGRVRYNRGARTAGVDGQSAYYVEQVRGVEVFLAELRAQLKSGAFSPVPVRERMIPKAGGKKRRLGIPTVRDRVVQASLKLVMEPIFEADFLPCSFGFRPNRRTHDAIAEIHRLGSRSYEWVLEADIKACFDEIDHTALMGRVRRRIGDKRVLRLVKAFLKAGILTEMKVIEETMTGTPQGGIISPLLANIALSVLDEHFQARMDAMGSRSSRYRARRSGAAPICRLIRYADDFVVMVSGSREQAEALRAEAAAVVAAMGLRLSEEKTQVVHIDEGFDFLGFRIQRRRKKGTNRRYVYTYPSKKSILAITRKVRAHTHKSRFRTLSDLLRAINPVIRGWCAYFRYGVSKATFSYLDAYTWRRVVWWLRKRHPKTGIRVLRRRFLPKWRPTDTDGVTLYNAASTVVRRYTYRGRTIPTPWAERTAA